METSEQQAKIINLGKQLVHDLGLDNSVDTLSRWMAHYIAEKIVMAEKTIPGEEKNADEKECFDTILKLWERRWHLPSGKRPLEDFESLLKVLKRLDPENDEPFLHRHFDQDLNETEDKNPQAKEIADYIAIAVKIDKVARGWIEYILQQAAQKAKSDKTETYLKNAVDLRDSNDIEVIVSFLDDATYTSKKDEAAKKKGRIEKLNNRIEELNKFADLNTFILEKYKKELETLV